MLEINDNTDIIMYSKVTIARNVRGYNFPVKMSEEDKDMLLNSSEEFAKKIGMHFVRSDELSKEQRLDFLKKRIMPLNMAKAPENRGIIISEDESLSILVNYFNHFFIQGMCKGSQIEDLFDKTEKLAVAVESNFDIAYSERLGFLASRATDVGTALRVSFLVSIPGIERGGMMSKFQTRLAALDWRMIPHVGESNGRKTGTLYEISNVSTLGVTESKILERALMIIKDITKVERVCREAIFTKKTVMVEDQFYRAYGLFKYCRKLELDEALEALGWLRLGLSMIEDDETGLDIVKINEMTDQICTEMKSMRGNSPEKISVLRANKIRSIMEGADE